jgi:peptide chain release factor subunit 1
MKVTRELLKRLSQLRETKRTVLSVYMDMTHGWDKVATFVEHETARLLPLLNTEEKDYFETSRSFLYDYLNEKKREQYNGPGSAFFADIGADYCQGVELPVAPVPLCIIDDEAYIHPLALVLDEYEPVGVIMVDASSARVLITAGQTIEGVSEYKERIHHLSKVGGWSQMRYQRRRAKQVQHFLQDVVDRATKIFKDAHVQRVLISGRNRMITSLEKMLPQEWQKRVIAVIRWDLDEANSDFMQKIKPVLAQREREEEEFRLEALTAELRRDGLAVAGLEATEQALKIGQVDTLFLLTSIEPELSEALTSHAQLTGAYVEFVPSADNILKKFGGVAALLRFKI